MAGSFFRRIFEYYHNEKGETFKNEKGEWVLPSDVFKDENGNLIHYQTKEKITVSTTGQPD